MAAKRKRRFVLSHHRSPGDLVCLTALVRDIQLTYPGEFELDFNTSVEPVWENNPYLTRLWNHSTKAPRMLYPDVQMVTCKYGNGLREQNKETIHFCNYFHRDFKQQTGIDVPLRFPHGDIHLSTAEKNNPPVHGRYWLVLSGGKSDFPIKVWHTKYFQEITDRLGEMGLGVVQTGAAHTGHWHPTLQGDHVINLCGWGSFREFVSQIYHAEGVICGVTGAMHIAAALHKPCVVVAGGREAWWWEAYVNENKGFGKMASGKHPMPHKFLHTIGLLPCCSHYGCWKNKVVPSNGDPLVCKRPIMTPEMPIAECMQLITPDHVMDAVMQYYTDGSLPPIKLSGSIQPSPEPAAPPIVKAQTTGAAEKLPAQAPNSKPAQAQPSPCKTGACPPSQPPGKKRVKTSASIVIPKGVPIVINPNAKIRTNTSPAKPAAPATPNFSDQSVMDHPSVGSRYTAFILFYGDHHDLHKQCLASFLATTNSNRIDLRVGSNAVCQATYDMIEGYVKQGLITKHYYHPENAYKYPVMREMFHDPECPITTKWILWFDDDSICDVEPNWLNILSIHISQHHKGRDGHMIGGIRVWSPNSKQRAVFEGRPWFMGRAWRNAQGQPSPNGNKIVFATGGFWAITKEAMLAADIPDLGTGLTHTGGDWQIGEQLYQAGYGMKQFNSQKQFVRTSSVARRGVTMPTVDQVAAIPTIPVNNQPPVEVQPLPVQPQSPKLRVIKL